MNKHEAMTIGQIIEAAIARTGNRNAYAEQQACFLWAEIVGPSVNSLTVRRTVVDGVMHVWLTSGPLKNELKFHRDKIVEKINQSIGEKVIRDILFH